MAIDPSLSFPEAFQFAMVVASTVGYGDYSGRKPPHSGVDRFVILIYAFASIALLAEIASTIMTYAAEKKQLQKSEKFMDGSLLTEKQLLDFDTNGDGTI